MEGTSTRADEDEARGDGTGCARGLVLDLDVPAAIGGAGDVEHVEAVVEFGSGAPEIGGELARQRTEIDVGASFDAGGCDGLRGITPLHHQWCPPGDGVVVLAVLHGAEQRLRAQRLVAAPQVLCVGLTPDEAHVGYRIDEGPWVADETLGHHVGPELARDLELLVDGHCLGGVHRSVLAGGRVVQFAQGRVAGARIVPGVGALEAGDVEPLEEGDGPVRLELPQEGSERRAHDASADQYDVGCCSWGALAHSGQPCPQSRGPCS